MREPGQAALACFFQLLGWTCQLFAVWTAMRAFHIHKPVPAAGLVLVLMNVATLFPLWPGNNVGLLQAAIALPLNSYYNVARSVGVAFGCFAARVLARDRLRYERLEPSRDRHAIRGRRHARRAAGAPRRDDTFESIDALGDVQTRRDSGTRAPECRRFAREVLRAHDAGRVRLGADHVLDDERYSELIRTGSEDEP